MGTLLILGPCCLWALPSVVAGVASAARAGWVCIWGPSEGTGCMQPSVSVLRLVPRLVQRPVSVSSHSWSSLAVPILKGPLSWSQKGHSLRPRKAEPSRNLQITRLGSASVSSRPWHSGPSGQGLEKNGPCWPSYTVSRPTDCHGKVLCTIWP